MRHGSGCHALAPPWAPFAASSSGHCYPLNHRRAGLPLIRGVHQLSRAQSRMSSLGPCVVPSSSPSLIPDARPTQCLCSSMLFGTRSCPGCRACCGRLWWSESSRCPSRLALKFTLLQQSELTSSYASLRSRATQYRVVILLTFSFVVIAGHCSTPWHHVYICVCHRRQVLFVVASPVCVGVRIELWLKIKMKSESDARQGSHRRQLWFSITGSVFRPLGRIFGKYLMIDIISICM